MTDIIDDLLLAADMAEDFSGAGEGNLYLRAIAELRGQGKDIELLVADCNRLRLELDKLNGVIR